MARDDAAIDRLRGLADALAGTWAARAAVSTTLGRERALLRLFGVHGLDEAGRPLAGEVVDRYVAGSAARLAAGVALPFAVAIVEYDLPAMELALDVASGKIDLGLEADLLADPERRVAAETVATSLAGAALERIDANRTARAELLSILGEPPLPWVMLPLTETTIESSIEEARRLVALGADAIRVAVPAGRELIDRLFDAGVEPEAWLPGDASLATSRAGGPAEPIPADPTPAGSQRGLAELRSAVDGAAAERQRYVRIASSSPALAGPEQAVVAAFERLDIVEVDPLSEIVESGVDPDRVLADHAFAKMIQRRAGTLVVVGPGPLVVAPDIRRGVPSAPSTRAGRALALQALAVSLMRQNGLPADQLVVGALPGWLAGETDAVAQALAQVALRRALFPEHRLAFEEPAGTASEVPWSALLGAALPLAGDTALVTRRGGSDEEMARTVAVTRGAATAGREAADSLGPWTLRGPARAAADAALEAAVETLSRLADEGWEAILGEPIGGPDRPRLGANAVVERSEAFDPFAAARGG